MLEKCISKTIEFSQDRHAFGKAIIENQSIQFRLAELQTEVEALRALIYQACENFILGEEVKLFEKNFSKLSKTKYSIGCASGTDALILSLMALNLKKDDEVIVPGMTYISTGLSVLLNNNKLILVDINNDTGLIEINTS